MEGSRLVRVRGGGDVSLGNHPRCLETSGGFHVRTAEGFLFFKSFMLILTKFSFWRGDWALGCNFMKF